MPNKKHEKQPVKPVLKLVRHPSRKLYPQRAQRQPNKRHLPAIQIVSTQAMSTIILMTAFPKKLNIHRARIPHPVIADNTNAMMTHLRIVPKASKRERCTLPVSMNVSTNTVSPVHHLNSRTTLIRYDAMLRLKSAWKP
uniref:Uncharacterized protein n=1 Tax=Romanomermis culicivorax TaxID=13658 RepID=A0A915I139_ROMCU